MAYARCRLRNAKIASSRRFDLLDVDAVDDGARWSLGRPRHHRFDGGALPLELGNHRAVGRIAYVP